MLCFIRVQGRPEEERERVQGRNDFTFDGTCGSSLAHKRNCQSWIERHHDMSQKALTHVLAQDGIGLRWTPSLRCALFTAGEVGMSGCSVSSGSNWLHPIMATVTHWEYF